MKHPAEIETARLRLRPYRLDDLDALHDLFTHSGVRQYLLDDEIMPRAWVENEIRDSQACFERRGFGQWAVFPIDDEATLIGFCGFRNFHQPPELQLLYGVTPEYWNRGLATEVARAMIRRGFESHEFEVIIASTDAPNHASVRVMEKAGMTFSKRVEINGLDTIYYSMSRRDFESGPRPTPNGPGGDPPRPSSIG